ncbi:MAG: hypothetical protein U9R72_01315 [Chloroflexota bacterium]|nr:hypothetical protein [Chloroflexota bacterium]
MGALKQLTLSQKGVILLSALTLVLGLTNLGRAVLAVHFAARPPGLPTTVSLDYLAATAGLWGVTFIVCSVGLSSFCEWGRWAALAAVTLYETNAWANRLLFSGSDYARQMIPRDVALTVSLLCLFWIPLNLPQIRQTFKEDKEPQSAH